MYWSGHSESNLLRPSITFSTLPEPCRDLLSAMRRRVSAFVENCREQWRWQSGGQCGPCVQQCGKRASQSGLNSAIKSHLSKVLRLFVKVGTCTCQMCYTFCQSSYIYLWPLRVASTVPSDHMYSSALKTTKYKDKLKYPNCTANCSSQKVVSVNPQ